MSFLQLPSNHWGPVLYQLLDHRQTKQLNQLVEHEYQNHQCLPQRENIFKALALTDYQNVKVVILGQDPYPNPQNAQGLAFSAGRHVPASLKNIYVERYHDLGIKPNQHGDLTKWAQQGVLLLNTVLTTRAWESNSHAHLGWESFTDAIITSLNYLETPLVYILWGRNAQSKIPLIQNKTNNLILTASHPSPYSAKYSFFGSYPFSKTNHFLVEHGSSPIDWSN